MKRVTNQNKTKLEPKKRKEIKGDMEEFLNKRLQMLEKVFKNAIDDENYSLALNIDIRIDEIKELLYLLKNEENLIATNECDQKED